MILLLLLHLFIVFHLVMEIIVGRGNHGEGVGCGEVEVEVRNKIMGPKGQLPKLTTEARMR